VCLATNLLKQLDAQRAFEMAHLSRDSRLAKMQFLGGANITTMLGNDLKGVQLMQIQSVREHTASPAEL
jgi:hypothetical protein